jgi:hypothetical protein
VSSCSHASKYICRTTVLLHPRRQLSTKKAIATLSMSAKALDSFRFLRLTLAKATCACELTALRTFKCITDPHSGREMHIEPGYLRAPDSENWANSAPKVLLHLPDGMQALDVHMEFSACRLTLPSYPVARRVTQEFLR